MQAMSLSGSPSTTIRSARRPGASTPRSLRPIASAAVDVTARRISAGVSRSSIWAAQAEVEAVDWREAHAGVGVERVAHAEVDHLPFACEPPVEPAHRADVELVDLGQERAASKTGQGQARELSLLDHPPCERRVEFIAELLDAPVAVLDRAIVGRDHRGQGGAAEHMGGGMFAGAAANRGDVGKRVGIVLGAHRVGAGRHVAAGRHHFEEVRPFVKHAVSGSADLFPGVRD